MLPAVEVVWSCSSGIFLQRRFGRRQISPECPTGGFLEHRDLSDLFHGLRDVLGERVHRLLQLAEVERRLLELRGIGPWTASYVAMRALHDPDAFLPSDLGVRKAICRLGHAGDRQSVAAVAERWRPWRAYATQHLWASLGDEKDRTAKGEIVA